jgi:hypothetical protein
MVGAQAKAQFKRRSTANNVEISIPVPDDADTPRFRTNIGAVHYAPEKSAIVWKIKQFGGGKEFLMRAELGLPSVKGDDEHGGGMTGGFGGSMGGVRGEGKAKRPISVKFEIPYFTTSGIQVRYLKIIEPKVRGIHSYMLRLNRQSVCPSRTLTDSCNSSNILPCPGYDISHSPVTSLCDCPTYNKAEFQNISKSTSRSGTVSKSARDAKKRPPFVRLHYKICKWTHSIRPPLRVARLRSTRIWAGHCWTCGLGMGRPPPLDLNTARLCAVGNACGRRDRWVLTV